MLTQLRSAGGVYGRSTWTYVAIAGCVFSVAIVNTVPRTAYYCGAAIEVERGWPWTYALDIMPEWEDRLRGPVTDPDGLARALTLWLRANHAEGISAWLLLADLLFVPGVCSGATLILLLVVRLLRRRFQFGMKGLLGAVAFAALAMLVALHMLERMSGARSKATVPSLSDIRFDEDNDFTHPLHGNLRITGFLGGGGRRGVTCSANRAGASFDISSARQYVAQLDALGGARVIRLLDYVVSSDALHELKQSRSLRVLDVRHCAVTEGGLQQLKGSRPLFETPERNWGPFACLLFREDGSAVVVVVPANASDYVPTRELEIGIGN